MNCAFVINYTGNVPTTIKCESNIQALRVFEEIEEIHKEHPNNNNNYNVTVIFSDGSIKNSRIDVNAKPSVYLRTNQEK